MPRRSIHFTTPVDADPALHRSEEEPLPPYPLDETKRATNAPPSALAGTDLSEFFGPAGPLAQALEG
ncbi:hypothetical protein, partial [Caldilinea sp.]